ncbi:MAG: S1 family peptidase [Candidatus Omnitrophota bacterium]
MEDITSPIVCNAVRAVGVIKPQFDPSQRSFLPPQLRVSGTGFWLKNQEAFITCAHVVQNILGASIEVTGMLVVGGNSFEYRKATISVLDFVRDLAVLHVEADKTYLDAQVATGLEIIERKINIAEGVAYAGFPLGNELLNSRHSPTYSEGVIGSEILEDTSPKMIQISGSVAGGYSGAPIVLKSEPNKVIAVLANSPSKAAGDASIFKGIHWKHLKEIFDLISC